MYITYTTVAIQIKHYKTTFRPHHSIIKEEVWSHKTKLTRQLSIFFRPG